MSKNKWLIVVVVCFLIFVVLVLLSDASDLPKGLEFLSSCVPVKVYECTEKTTGKVYMCFILYEPESQKAYLMAVSDEGNIHEVLVSENGEMRRIYKENPPI